MEKSESKVGDFLGISEYGAAIKIIVEKGIGGAEAFLSRICLPAAEELGLLFRDKIKYLRLKNAIAVLEKAQNKIGFDKDGFKLEAHPKVIMNIIEGCSMEDDETLQEMWAGLLVSACTPSGEPKDDGNIIYVELLKQLTASQAKILEYICKNCELVKDENGLFWAEHIELTAERLFEIAGSNDFYKIDAELDYLRNKGLLQEGGAIVNTHGAGFCFNYGKLAAQLEPSALALNLYIKCQGYKGNVIDYFKITKIAYVSDIVEVPVKLTVKSDS